MQVKTYSPLAKPRIRSFIQART